MRDVSSLRSHASVTDILFAVAHKIPRDQFLLRVCELEKWKYSCGDPVSRPILLNGYPAPAFATLFCYERSELENKKCPCGTTLFCYERSELENKKCPCGESRRKARRCFTHSPQYTHCARICGECGMCLRYARTHRSGIICSSVTRKFSRPWLVCFFC